MARPEQFEFISDNDSDVGSEISMAGMTLELKKFDVRVDSKGEKTMLHTGIKYDFVSCEEYSRNSAITVTKSYNEKNNLLKTEMVIWSPYIVVAMKEVIVRYPDIDFNGETIVIIGPPRCLFHYREELAEYSDQHELQVVKSHIEFALGYMKTTLASDIYHYTNCMLNRASNGGLDFERLWMAYRPGDIIYCKEDKERFCGRLYRMSKREGHFYSHWTLQLETIICAGTKMEYGTLYIHTNRYVGLRRLSDLRVYPLKYHREQASIRENLRKRGEQLFNFRGVHQRYYRGHALWARDPPPGQGGYYSEEDEYPKTKFQVSDPACLVHSISPPIRFEVES